MVFVLVVGSVQGWPVTAPGLLLPLAVRRIAALPVLVVVSLSACGSMLVLGARYPAFEVAFAIYPLAVSWRTRRSVSLLIVVSGALGAAAWLGPPVAATGSPAGLMAATFVLVGGATVLGGTVRAHRRHLARLHETTAREERLHLARELHDAVGHRMSVIALQAGVANVVAGERPEEARRALSSIEETSRTGLRELRALVGLLRDDRPPGVADLDALVLPVRAAGLRVRVSITGTVRALPPEVGAAVYRIVQEALTNVVRHAAATKVDVVVGYTAAAVEVRVTDDGAGTPGDTGVGPAGTGGRGLTGMRGRGLTGMRERAELLGGEFSAGPLRAHGGGGGYLVCARLPLEEVPA
ncbi:sensor histidine kinase [Actinoplanes couchii]|uniref:histidine kinase n=1 Tax=Actinoplanes couchii TaxID=403638 RepID=A0ABQ3WZU2_9ACTN|nr:two-component sensor histidine kinase [Actinoplanes couchii]